MSSEKLSYEIKHNWGDPREPEFINEHKVSYVHYKEEGIQLYFKVYAKEKTELDEIKWVFQAPKNMREQLDRRWPYRAVIFSRVKSYLKQLDEPYFQYRQVNDFSNASADISQIENWYVAQKNIFRKKYPTIIKFLPREKTTLLCVLGLLFLFTKHYFLPIGSMWISYVLKFIGVLISLFFIKDLKNDFFTFRFLYGMRQLTSGYDYFWRVRAIKSQINMNYGRYLLTIFLIIVFVFQ